MISKSNLSIVVLSYDGFEELWDPFFDHFFNSWPDCPYKIFLLTNFLNYDDARVTSLQVGEDQSWSRSLKIGIDQINSDWILFFYDDTFITKINFDKLKSSLNFLDNSNAKSLVLRPNLFIPFFSTGFKVFQIPENALYRNALFSNIFDRKYLSRLLIEGETAWDFEIKGNGRSQKELFFSVNKSVINYKHGIVKGFWLPETLCYLQNKGYKFNKLYKSYSYFQSFKMKILTISFRIYYKFMPLKYLIFIEKKRIKI
jgi:hypothetical protein